MRCYFCPYEVAGTMFLTISLDNTDFAVHLSCAQTIIRQMVQNDIEQDTYWSMLEDVENARLEKDEIRPYHPPKQKF